MTRHPRLTVQMCTYNRKGMLMQALQALFNQSLPHDQYEIVLVDDGSSDGTREAVAALTPPCGFKYCWQENSGLSKGRNHGIREASGEIVLFIDDDIVAHRDLLLEHVRWHDRHPKHVIRGWVNHTEHVTQDTTPKFTLADISTAFFWTSNVSVGRQWLLEAGMFDEEFREYGWEDLELGMRLKKLGLQMKYNKAAIVYHQKPRWTLQDVPKMLRQAQAKARTALIFVRKHPTWRVRLATGLDPLHFGLHRVLNPGGMGERLWRRLLPGGDDGPLQGLSLFAARQLVNCTYFETLKQNLK
ncbi:MAG: glycosyltransferase family 2 protein [Candidatus Xenobia bacterium]